MGDARYCFLVILTLVPVCFGTVTFTIPTNGSASINVTENTTGTLYTVEAVTDVENANITYRISTSVPQEDFVMSGADLNLRTGKRLDYETGPRMYNVTIEAVDDAQPAGTATATLMIHVTDVDDVPRFRMDRFCVVVASNSTEGTVVGIFNATDPQSTPLTYSYSGDDATPKFAYNPTTGNLTRTDATLDASNTTYMLTLNATDTDGNVGQATLKVNIGGSCQDNNGAGRAGVTLMTAFLVFALTLIAL